MGGTLRSDAIEHVIATSWPSRHRSRRSYVTESSGPRCEQRWDYRHSKKIRRCVQKTERLSPILGSATTGNPTSRYDSEKRKYQPTASRIISGSNCRHLNKPQTEEARRNIRPAYHGLPAKLQHFPIAGVFSVALGLWRALCGSA